MWRARRIAQAVLGKPDDVVAHIDEAVAPIAEKVGPVILDRLIDEAMMRLYPEEREPAQLEALDARHVTLHEESLNETGVGEMTIRGDWKDLHDFDETVSLVADRLAEADEAEGRVPDSRDVRRSRAVGVLADPEAAAATARRPAGAHAQAPRHARVPPQRGAPVPSPGSTQWRRNETTSRPVLEQQIRDWCGRTDTHLTVLPVVDLADHESVDRYEVSDRLQTRVGLLTPTCVFPWCSPSCPPLRQGPRDRPRRRWRHVRLQPGPVVPASPSAQDQGGLAISNRRDRRLALVGPAWTALPPRRARHHRHHPRSRGT